MRRARARRAHERHRDYFLALAEQAEPKLSGPEQAAWLTRFGDGTRQPARNTRGIAGLGFRDEFHADDGGAVPLLGRPGSFHAGAGMADAGAGAGRAGGRGRTAVRRLSARRGESRYRGCDYPAARALFEESLLLRQEMNDRQGVANTLNNLGQIAAAQERPDEARDLLEQSLSLQRKLNDREGMASSLGNLALLALAQEDDGRAERLFKESLVIDRTMGDLWGCANSLDGLGRVACRAGDFDSGATDWPRACRFGGNGRRPGIAECLEAFAALAAAQGKCGAAAMLWGAAEARREEFSASPAGERPRGLSNGTCQQPARRSVNPRHSVEQHAAGRLLSDEDAAALALDPPEEESQ